MLTNSNKVAVPACCSGWIPLYLSVAELLLGCIRDLNSSDRSIGQDSGVLALIWWATLSIVVLSYQSSIID